MNAPFALSLETIMSMQRIRSRAAGLATGMLFILALALSTQVLAATAKMGAQKTFATPEAAVDALVAAAKANDTTAIRSILGSGTGDLSSGDAVADKTLREQFVTSYEAKHSLSAAGQAMKLSIGKDDFPFAFPLVKTGERWHFDTQAGRDELNLRRIGENELNTIQVMEAIVDAQREYASKDRNGDGVLDYAMKFASSPGKKDGLYWPTAAGEPPSPLGDLVVKAQGEGYTAKKGAPTPYHGYYFRMLKGQAAQGDNPAFDYVVRGHAIAGFGVIAWPAKYGSSGIMSFMVNQDGKVYEADLGPKSDAKANAMRLFDPGKNWTPVKQQ
jgi:hypothetical protein